MRSDFSALFVTTPAAITNTVMNPLPVQNQAATWTRLSAKDIVGHPPHTARLSNGCYHIRLNATGSGYSECRGVAVSRASGDEISDADGFHIYLRDLEDGFTWSAGYQPTRTIPADYEFRYSDTTAEIARMDEGIETVLSVGVMAELDGELRRLRLTNHTNRPRRIQVTSYIELVLNTPPADASHPTFSKLFVETKFCGTTRSVIARRRPRAPGESENWAFHRLLTPDDELTSAEFQFETNRARFIGRGRTLARPRALDADACLTGDVGPVLDPIASLRTTIELAPGQARELVFALGFTQSRQEVEDTIVALSEKVSGTLFESAKMVPDTFSNFSNGESDGMARPVLIAKGVASDGVAAKRREVIQRVNASSPSAPPADPEPLLFDNGYGGFTSDGREYVIRLRPDKNGLPRRPPQPWCNIIANESAGFLVTESGAGYTWAGNSRLNRLSAWHNDPVCDPHSEAVWIRDDETGAFWSPTPGPTPAAGDYEARHGFGYTTFRHESHELSQNVTLFIAADDPVKLARVRLVNRADRPRRVTLFAYTHWALGDLASATAPFVETKYDDRSRAILATNPQREVYDGHVAFSALVADESTPGARLAFTCDRAEFLGRGNDVGAPQALNDSRALSGSVDPHSDPCAAWQLAFELPPGATFDCTLLLGEAETDKAARHLVERYRAPRAADQTLELVKQRWRETLNAVQIETPDPEIDLVTNGWLMYQNLSCRIYGRSAYYQPGGAFGFRDQLQDAAAYVYHRPPLTRKQILLHASQQFLEGDVLHWWHDDTGYGLRTRFSDDLLWLPFVTASYVRTTGDRDVLDEMTPFITAPPLAVDEQEAYLRPEPAGVSATVYEHCCRALDRGLTTGPHGLPLIGCGDWNDGMNRVGVAGRGESVWLGFFICHILDLMLPLCRKRGDTQRAERYEAYREQLVDALESAGWDGAWYRRAYYDNGQPVGSAANDECQIDAIAQAWAVISGVAPPGRVALAMGALEERLVDSRAGMIRLLTPPFNATPNAPGYIKGYLPGIRENGGQYTHGVLWVVRAMAELGRGTRAVELLKMLSPISHTRTADDVAIYQTEPYVVAADVYGEPPHVGRGGWTWYTGSAGWMFRVAIESVFGMTLDGGRTLVLNPSISRDWPTATLRYRLPDGITNYTVTIDNAAGREHGVQQATVDGEPLLLDDGVARVPLKFDGREHHVTLTM